MMIEVSKLEELNGVVLYAIREVGADPAYDAARMLARYAMACSPLLRMVDASYRERHDLGLTPVGILLPVQGVRTATVTYAEASDWTAFLIRERRAVPMVRDHVGDGQWMDFAPMGGK